jgi:hypothetical protein
VRIEQDILGKNAASPPPTAPASTPPAFWR